MLTSRRLQHDHQRSYQMNCETPDKIPPADSISARASELFREQQQNIVRHTDEIFVRLMLLQWLFGIGLAFWISPRAWSGVQSQIHLHVWAAILLGGAVTSLPVLLGLTQPGRPLTRHTVAIGQMLMSA